MICWQAGSSSLSSLCANNGLYLLGPGTEVIGSLLILLWRKGAIDLVFALSVINVIIMGAGVFRRHLRAQILRWPCLAELV